MWRAGELFAQCDVITDCVFIVHPIPGWAFVKGQGVVKRFTCSVGYEHPKPRRWVSRVGRRRKLHGKSSRVRDPASTFHQVASHKMHTLWCAIGVGTSRWTLSWRAPFSPYKRSGMCGSVHGYRASKGSLGPLWMWRLCSHSTSFSSFT